MADENREKKLAAARKKLQRFQQKRTPANSPAPAKTPKLEEGTPSSQQTKPAVSATPPRVPREVHRSTPLSSKNPGHTPLQNSFPGNSDHHSQAVSPDTRNLSSAESLRQLSMRVNGLVAEAQYFNGLEEDNVDTRTRLGINQLEVRNQELAADRDEQALSNQQLQLHIGELRNHCEKLQGRLQKERKEADQRLFKEQSSIREQLQVHIQTIGILVSEKSDLQSTLAQSQQSLKQKAGEADNLSSRLQASRQRLAELERDLASATSSSHQYQKASVGLDKDKDALKLDVYKLQKANEELSQRQSEISSQLKSKVQETTHLEQIVQNLQGRLSESELRAHQLTNQSTQQDIHNALLKAQEEKSELEAKLAQYNQSFHQLTAEREQLAQQFQQHTEHYQRQAQELIQQLQTQVKEKELVTEKQAELEQQIAAMKSAKDSEQGNLISQEELTSLQQRIHQLKTDKQSIHGQFQQQVGDNAQLSRLYQEKEERVDDLERQLSRLQEESSDRAVLLESIQGDKATISRAVAQNKELKIQLEELQSAFVKMTNDNMEIFSNLQSEQHVNQELGSQLGDQEEELKNFKQQLLSKESECNVLRTQTYGLNKQLLQQATMADRAQHYEAQSHNNETLQKDLTAAQTRLRDLSEENSGLRVRIAKLERNELVSSKAFENTGIENSHEASQDMVDSMLAAIRQLEMERDQLTESFHEQQAQHMDQMDKIRRQQEQEPAVLSDAQFVTKESFETMNTAMDMLQDRFAAVMRDKAELSERCQELEHINLQLSGETETIGEYISLYHSQRDMMKRRQEERERFVASLAKDKDEMQLKLTQLQNLMMQLIQEEKHQTLNQLPAFLGSSPGVASQINSPASPFGGGGVGLANAHPQHPRSHDKKKQTLSGSLDSTNLDDDSEDWPSISDSTSSDSVDDATMADEHYHTAHNLTLDNTLTSNQRPSDHTAQQIMELLEQIGGSHIIDRGTILDRDFAPCKCCSGTLVDV